MTNDSLIEKLEAELYREINIANGEKVSERSQYRNGLRFAREIIRQHQAAQGNIVERVTNFMQDAYENAPAGELIWDRLAKAAIAAMNMGEVHNSSDKDFRSGHGEGLRGSNPASSSQPSEISVVKELRENIDNILHIDYSSISAQVQDILELIYPYLRTAEPVLKVDAAEALSKAILEAHAKWQAKYQGVGHVD